MKNGVNVCWNAAGSACSGNAGNRLIAIGAVILLVAGGISAGVTAFKEKNTAVSRSRKKAHLLQKNQTKQKIRKIRRMKVPSRTF